MSLLVCAATAFELEALPDDPRMVRVVSGVGIAATLLHLMPAFFAESTRPSLILNIGIAGAYPDTGIALGDIVIADSETWGDVGFTLPEAPGFQPITESSFGEWYAQPLPTVRPQEWTLPEPLGANYRVHTGRRGCTVNTCTGTDAVGIFRRDCFGAAFETMEGAAVAAVGRERGIPVCEIRAISNYAARREMRPENIRRALDNLRHYLAWCVRTV